jgi:hypothetical protein
LCHDVHAFAIRTFRSRTAIEESQAAGHHLRKEIMELLWEIAGWTGAAAILGAYLAVSMGWLKAGRRFQTANLFGACAFILNGAFHEAWPSVVTNVAWFLISAVALVRMRTAGQTAVPAPEDAQVQFPGVPDTTGQLAVVEVLTGAVHGDAEGQRPPR